MTDTASNPPSGWQIFLLGDLLNFKNGLNKEKSFFGYGTPIINYMDVFSRSPIYARTVKGLVSVSKAEKKAFEVRKGDILFTRTSETPDEVGYAAVVMDEMEEAVFSGFVLRGRPVSSTLSNNYARYFLEASYVRQQIVASATYTTRALTNGRLLSAVKVLLPEDISEQEAIAEALSDADALIEGLERLISKKRLIKQGAMQDLLTAKRRLPGFSENWKNVTLPSLASIRSGGTPDTTNPAYWGGEISWLTPTDITALNGKKYLSQTARQITPLGLSNSAAELLPIGTIVMTSRATIGECAIAIKPVSTNQGFKNFIPHENTSGDFLYYLLGSQKNGFIELCSGSTFLEIGMKQLNKYVVYVPTSLEEQKEIAAVLSDMDADIQALEIRLDKARQIKEGMMQNLLTGRISVKSPPSLSPAVCLIQPQSVWRKRLVAGPSGPLHARIRRFPPI